MPYPSEYIENGMKLIDALYQSTKDGDITIEERYNIVTTMEHDLVVSKVIDQTEGLFDWSEQKQRAHTDVYSAIQKAEKKVLQR